MEAADLQAWRKRAGMSQAELADVLGVTVQTISRWERNAKPIPKMVPLALIGLTFARPERTEI